MGRPPIKRRRDSAAGRPPPDADLLTVNQALARLNISRSTFYRLVHDGDLRLIKLRGASRVAARDIAEFILRQGL